MKYIDNFLNSITMYRLVMWGLAIMAILAVIFSFFNWVAYNWIGLTISFFVLLITCEVSNRILAKLFHAHRNVESAYISALILFFILLPVGSADLPFLIITAILTMVSKYVLAFYKKHIFNPVAVSILIMGLFGGGLAIWWVATPMMSLPGLVLGFLILRKTKRFSLFFAFAITSIVGLFATQFASSLSSVSGIWSALSSIMLSWPLLFFGTVMLTEPTTTPPKRSLQIVYGIIVGVFFSLQFHIGTLYGSPELALVLGNIFSYIVSPKRRLMLTLKEKKTLSKDVYHFTFEPDRKMEYKPGQYMEWTLEHSPSDTRGNRRYFTIASAPTESTIQLGIKIFDKPSTFKQKLISLEPGDSMTASQLAGEFTLPEDTKKKLVFLAGGIGVTPFRSMVRYLLDRKEKRDITLFYSNKFISDIVYKDLFDEAQRELGIKVIYAVTDEATPASDQSMRHGFIDPNLIMKEVPDFAERDFYISGPHGMVMAFETSLQKIGVKKSAIKTDLFPGFA